MDKYDEAYEKLRPKCLEISDIILDVLNKIDSKEEFDHLPISKFGKLISFFTHLVISMVHTGRREESLSMASEFCLGKIDKRMSELQNIK